MVKKKGKSGRISLKQKYKIKRKVTEHHRKQRKEAKKNPSNLRRKPKDLGIPNSLPFKEEVLAEVARAKEREEEHRRMAKEKRRAELMKRRGLTPEGQTLEGLVSNAEKSQQEFEKMEADKVVEEYGDKDKNARYGQSSRRAYFRELKKVVEKADVVLEVLDARDPLGSRAEAVEDAVLSRAGKKLVLVLNKVDLVPKEVVAKWLRFLRRSLPAVAFKASTQEKFSSIKQTKGSADKAANGMLNLSGAVGTEALMGLLKNYCRTLNLKTAITVGVIGYPNVGKSSLINSLKRSKSVGVSATPGFTKVMQEIHLDKTVKLLDCPGIVFDDSDAGATLLRNCVDAESMEDPMPAVAAMLKRCSPEQLMQVYSIRRFDLDDPLSFLSLIARKTHKLTKKGLPDHVRAAKMVLKDWNTGKVPFYTMPPEEVAGGSAGAKSVVLAEAMIVEGFGEDFDVEAGDAQVLKELPECDSTDYVTVGSGNIGKGRWTEEDEDAEQSGANLMDEDESEDGGSKEDDESGDDDDDDDDDDGSDASGASGAQTPKTVNASAGASNPRAALDAMLASERVINPQVNRSLKKARKAEKKKQKKAATRASMSPSPAVGSAEDMGGEYDFGRDFYGKEDEGEDSIADLSDDDDL